MNALLDTLTFPSSLSESHAYVKFGFHDRYANSFVDEKGLLQHELLDEWSTATVI